MLDLILVLMLSYPLPHPLPHFHHFADLLSNCIRSAIVYGDGNLVLIKVIRRGQSEERIGLQIDFFHRDIGFYCPVCRACCPLIVPPGETLSPPDGRQGCDETL